MTFSRLLIKPDANQLSLLVMKQMSVLRTRLWISLTWVIESLWFLMQRVRRAKLMKLAWSAFEAQAESSSAPRAYITSGSGLWKKLMHLKALESQPLKGSFYKDNVGTRLPRPRSTTARATESKVHASCKSSRKTRGLCGRVPEEPGED